MSSERELAKAAFLDANGFGDARREPMGGDASTRAYERLHQDGETFIFMDQPPALESAPCPPDATAAERHAAGYNALARLAAGRVDAFIACALYLKSCGLSAPDILAADPGQGLAVLEDLGDDLFARLLETGAADEAELYDAAIDALVLLHGKTPPQVLPPGWPLLTYDDLALETAQNLFVDWMPKLRPSLSFTPAAIAEWEAIWAPIRKRGADGASVFCHRDYHAENLIWLPGRKGAARVGLLDFQDAVLAHPAWDLSMLLHDARRDVSSAREAHALARYLAARPDLDAETFLAEFHALGALNILRILGIFARLVTRDDKPRYLAFMPRLWDYLDRCLADPSLNDLKLWVERYVPDLAR